MRSKRRITAMSDQESIEQAARAVADAEALIIGAGAGMGVDSGLPDFRGNEGFWNAYPPYKHLGLSFVQMANPDWFTNDPALAWGFYGHRMNLYRLTQPHEGFQILLRWANRMKAGAAVYTSNVDGAFQKSGFDPDSVLEVHGSCHWMQCLKRCGSGLFPSDSVCPGDVIVDPATARAADPLPKCPKCGGLARPNILMFNDDGWDERRSFEQEQRLGRWLRALPARTRVAVVECGAGKAIPTVRHFCESMASRYRGTLVRINVRESDGPGDHVGLALGALAALREMDRLMPPV
jgi:NAD-dependent SIR2 family protein deacetylase